MQFNRTNKNILKYSFYFILTYYMYIKWVENILEGRQEAESLIFNDKDPETGFIIVPDR